tara:strand:- start:2111 stop:2389 length:279 start_codon:yes stop_codon:yes gene_type:complete
MEITAKRLKEIKAHVEAKTGIEVRTSTMFGDVVIEPDIQRLSSTELRELSYYIENHLDVLLWSPKLQIINDNRSIFMGIRIPISFINEKIFI